MGQHMYHTDYCNLLYFLSTWFVAVRIDLNVQALSSELLHETILSD